jgi:hypothetical protein
MAGSNIQHVFSMDEEPFVGFLGQLQALSMPAAYLLSELNLRIEARDAVRAQLRRGAVTIASSLVALYAAVMVVDQAVGQALWALLFAVTLALGVGGFSQGIARMTYEREAIKKAAAAQAQLEGEEGFLWRFEPLLQDWDQNQAPAVRETLPEICRASKNGTLGQSLDVLRAYWYWAARCEARMKVAKAEMRW